ncbi:hypothetical protein [Streptomyces sp. NPDC051561]|uniref:hypothetical protein n=1 Tax=Streptomyces sp. NPDC051561 TaxID=3365658 RepID=UPI0037B96135
MHAPDGTTASEIIARAGGRWQVEEDSEINKQLVGLAQYQVRKWTPWHRHVTACMLATAFLAVQRAAFPEPEPEPDESPAPKKTRPRPGARSSADPRAAAAALRPHHPTLPGRHTPHLVKTILTCESRRRLHQTRALVSHYRRRCHPRPPHLHAWSRHQPIPPITDPQDLLL